MNVQKNGTGRSCGYSTSTSNGTSTGKNAAGCLRQRPAFARPVTPQASRLASPRRAAHDTSGAGATGDAGSVSSSALTCNARRQLSATKRPPTAPGRELVCAHRARRHKLGRQRSSSECFFARSRNFGTFLRRGVRLLRAQTPRESGVLMHGQRLQRAGGRAHRLKERQSRRSGTHTGHRGRALAGKWGSPGKSLGQNAPRRRQSSATNSYAPCARS